MRELIDTDGENLAVRTFLLLYGTGLGVRVGAMQTHMKCSGFALWPAWVPDQLENHLTKGGAQAWLRHLFSLENNFIEAKVEVDPHAEWCPICGGKNGEHGMGCGDEPGSIV